MKTIKYIFLILAMVFTVSCDKHEIGAPAKPLEDGMAEFQLHYFVPVVVNDANNINRVEINDVEYSNSTHVLNTYNAIPSGSVGLFYAVKAGQVNIKMYSPADDKVYDKNVTLKVGKQNIFVYDFEKDPVVIDNGYPYETVISENTAEVAWVKFYNFLYESDGVYTDKKLQYQYQYTNTETGEKSDWINVGNPVAFSEATEWVQIRVMKSIYNSSGYARIDYKIKVQDESGNYTEDLQVLNSAGKYVSYSDYWTGYVGRRYHHIYGGMRTKAPLASVRQFTAR